MITKKIYMCEDSIEGIFTGIYDAWNSKYGHQNIRIQVKISYDESTNLELFSEYIDVVPHEEKTQKVVRAIKDKISEEAFDMVCKAAWSHEKNKGDLIYRFLILGFHMGAKVTQYLGNDVVMGMFHMNRNVGNEAHHFTGFIRFSEIEHGILFAKINPKNDILRLIAPHFSERFNTEHFIIYDEQRKTAIIHRSGYPWIFAYGDEWNVEKLQTFSEKEEEYRDLWNVFFDSISIKERENEKLQRNNLPKRFRRNMTEFKK